MHLREQIIAILRDEVGPAAPLLLDRCCRKNLGKNPAELTVHDIHPLSESCYETVVTSLGQPAAEKLKASLQGLE
ncbi:MAG: hypothetical protein QCH35_07200 [Methanomicrobiaceae archaeon]|nr:hypothetical protein [Methanomicrobiaceae archaeon]